MGEVFKELEWRGNVPKTVGHLDDEVVHFYSLSGENTYVGMYINNSPKTDKPKRSHLMEFGPKSAHMSLNQILEKSMKSFSEAA